VRADDAITNSVVINGGGTLHITGLDDTAGTFVFSGNGANGSYSFSASDGASVPEPASAFLLVIGLLGIVGLVQRQTKGQNQQL
jgi:hypothetical protein